MARRAISRPGLPKMSPTNRMRIAYVPRRTGMRISAVRGDRRCAAATMRSSPAVSVASARSASKDPVEADDRARTGRTRVRRHETPPRAGARSWVAACARRRGARRVKRPRARSRPVRQADPSGSRRRSRFPARRRGVSIRRRRTHSKAPPRARRPRTAAGHPLEDPVRSKWIRATLRILAFRAAASVGKI